jgi:serine/threonine-protein kinase
MDHHLLLGALAVQAELIDPEQFTAALADWTAKRGTSFAQLLLDRGWITEADRQHLDYLVEVRLRKHGGDASAGLASLAADRVTLALQALPSAGFLTPPPPGETPALPATAPGAPSPLPSPDSAWRYSRSRLHATGGIGQIWLARDEAIGRDVALKELRPETAGQPGLDARFLEEARVTGRLEHPGVVPVYELAATPGDRQPYYTMRFVKGRTLSEAVKEYHEQRRRGAAGALELVRLVNAFVMICNTVAFAHARGVLHRDLKGANVLLGDFGEVILLDWGLAKQLREGGNGEPSPVSKMLGGAPDQTQVGQLLGTPAYMAPEQAAGRTDLLDRRTDVYGLGAILYEILTGQPPFTGGDLTRLLVRVLEEEPTPPRRLNPAAPRPLEAVCLKALAKRPERRYPSAEELGRDVQRWLADEPVRAYREPWHVRLGRAARRHKTLVTGLGALLLTAVVALALSTVLINRQKARAEANFQLALDAVDRFFVQVSEDRLLNEPALQPLRKELLQTAREFDERFVAENATDPARQADLAKALYMLAKITAEIDDPAKAVELYERALGRYRYLEETDPRNLEYRRGRALCHLNIGVVTRAAGPVRAEREYKEALQLFEALSKDAPDDLDVQVRLALCHNNLSQLCKGQGRQSEAVEHQDQALAIQRQLVDREPDNPQFLRDLAGSLSNRATLYLDQKDVKAALEAQGQSLELRRRLVKQHPRVFAYQEDLGQSLNNLALTQEQADQYGEALRSFQECLRVREKLVASTPGVPRFREQLAWTYNNLSVLYKMQKQPAERDKAIQKAIALMEALHDDFKEEGTYAVSLAGVELSAGYHAHYDGRHEAALEWFGKVIGLLAPDGPGKVRDAAARPVARDAYWTRARSLKALKRFADALADYGHALALDDGPNRTELRLERAQTFLRLGDYARSADDLDALADDEKLTGDYCFALALVYCRVAKLARLDAALPESERERRIAAHREKAADLLMRADKLGFFKEEDNRKRATEEKDLEEIGPKLKEVLGKGSTEK